MPCFLCTPRMAPDDLAPSSVQPLGNCHFSGNMSELLGEKPNCARCATLADGIMNFANMFRCEQDFDPSELLIEWNAPYGQTWSDDIPFQCFTQGFGKLDIGFPSELVISFRFQDRPMLDAIHLRAMRYPTNLRNPRNLSDQTAHSLSTIQKWISTCNDQHGDQCSHRDESAKLPSRLLQLEESTGTVRLVNVEALTKTSSLPGNRMPLSYVALSHCWGDQSTNVETTTSNLEDMMQPIPVSSLPKTFADSIYITQKLEYNLIWIDSLCIVQDDVRDWETESARMADIYKNACLTIAATRSSNGQGGCFSTLNDTPYIWHTSGTRGGLNKDIKEDDYRLISHPSLWNIYHAKYRSGKDSFSRHFVLLSSYDRRGFFHDQSDVPEITNGYPLLTRAWFFQERLLSPRIIHFGYTEIAWECRSAFLLESFASEFKRTAQVGKEHKSEIYPLQGSQEARKKMIKLENGMHQSSQGMWSHLVEEFTRLSITHETDRLPALSGIAARAYDFIRARAAKDQSINYLAGIWSVHLPGGLLWTCSATSQRCAHYRGPTFSWVSVEGAINFNSDVKSHHDTGSLYAVCKVLRYDSIPNGMDPHGAVRHGTIEIEGWTGLCDIIEVRAFDERKGTVGVIKSSTTPAKRQTFRLDISQPVEVKKGAKLLLLMIECLKHKNTKYYAMYGIPQYDIRVLVLQQVQKVPVAWKRVGSIFSERYPQPGIQDSDMIYSPAEWVPEKKLVKIV